MMTIIILIMIIMLFLRFFLFNCQTEAGFYHNPLNQFSDRCYCFTCGVSLVSWEPTDEPWAEHKRHAPDCIYIKGKPNLNVPLNGSLSQFQVLIFPLLSILKLICTNSIWISTKMCMYTVCLRQAIGIPFLNLRTLLLFNFRPLFVALWNDGTGALWNSNLAPTVEANFAFPDIPKTMTLQDVNHEFNF